MTDVELGWLAGWIEGEGSFVMIRNGTTRGLRITAKTTDYDIALKASALLGVNRPPRPVKVPDHWKPTWQLQLCKNDEVVAMCARLRPLMGERRQQQIDELLTEWSNYRPMSRKDSLDKARVARWSQYRAAQCYQEL